VGRGADATLPLPIGISETAALKYLMGFFFAEIWAVGRSGTPVNGATWGAACVFFDHGHSDFVESCCGLFLAFIAIAAGSAMALVVAKAAAKNKAANVLSQALRMAGPP
jgi:hypothetical protein